MTTSTVLALTGLGIVSVASVGAWRAAEQRLRGMAERLDAADHASRTLAAALEAAPDQAAALQGRLSSLETRPCRMV